MRRLAIAVALVLAPAALCNDGGVLGQSPSDPASANYAMLGCRELVSKSNRLTELQRECASTVRTMIYVTGSRGICPPGRATVGSAVSVIVAYIDQRPERLHEQFETLALEALQQSWPCKR